MEGLIPFVYKAFIQYRNGNQGPMLGGSWFSESPSASYMRLPGDSGRFLPDNHGFSISTPLPPPSSSSSSSSATAQIVLSTGVQSPVCRLASRRVAA
ncbi:hypothetical protein Ddye_010848 [Dipteronia dyeriana]|uniref:Uncharacterized protein n=1 Tax=Dipteronia dyeriana TaxID=168575 RepID=A0AAD9XE18_9ROSI|nr:hypothetical protein Ddye_010848 [Dipteronia dyeriana]